MAVSNARKAWQRWKQAHPEFTKNRNFKADLGPQLDALDKARVSWQQAVKRADESLQQYAKAFADVKATVEAYAAIVNKIGDPNLKSSFHDDFATFLVKDLTGEKESVQDGVQVIIDDVKKIPPPNHIS
jgi:hypothetical protein